jgi:hypothetical protein
VTESFDRLSLALADRYRIERELGAGRGSAIFSRSVTPSTIDVATHPTPIPTRP